MKKYTKLSLFPLLGLIAMSLLTGCGGDGKTHVVFWHTFGKANQALLNTLIDNFERENPDIVVDASSQGGYPEIYTKLTSAIASGDVPTMATCYADHVADYLGANAVVDLSSYLTDEELAFTADEGSHEEGGVTKFGADDYVQGYWVEGEAYQTSGLYSVPYAKSTEVLFYNKDFFEENNLTVPTTWEEMWTLCANIVNNVWSSKDFSDKDKEYYALGYDSDSNMFITLCEQYGIPYTTNDNITTGSDHFLFNNDQAKALITTLKGYYDNHYLLTKGSMVKASYTSTYFTDGKVPMTIGSTGGTTYNDTDNFNVGIAPLPYVDSTHKQIISQGPSVCFMRRCSTAAKRAAWKFYKFITQSVNSAYYAMETGYDPVRTSSYSCDYYLNKMDESNIITDVFKVTQTLTDRYYSSPSFIGSATARNEVGGIISTYFTGAKTLNEAFSNAYSNCVQASGGSN